MLVVVRRRAPVALGRGREIVGVHAHTVQHGPGEQVGGGAIGGVGQLDAEQPVRHREVHGEGHQPEDEQRRIAGAEGACPLALNDVVAQEGKRWFAEQLPRSRRQFVPLERGVQHQPLEIGIALIAGQDRADDVLDERPVVEPPRETAERLELRRESRLARLLLENRRIQLRFRREVAEQQRFADAGGFGDGSRARAPEPARREQVQCRIDEVLAALLAAHADPGQRFGHRGGDGRCLHGW